MRSRCVFVSDPEGLHLRVAARIVKAARQHRSRVCLSCERCPRADACSILEVLLLRAGRGAPLTIRADGPDEEEAVRRVAEAIVGG